MSSTELVPVATRSVMLGGVGTSGARIGAEIGDVGDGPLLLMATTSNEYVIPGVRPVMGAAFICEGVSVVLI